MARFCFPIRYQHLFNNHCNTLYKTIYCRKHYVSTSGLSDGNIFKSLKRQIPDYNGMFLHEHIWQNADKWWNKTALECAETGRSYTYEQLKRLSGRLATSLRKSKLQPGDTIAAILPNVPEYVILLLGASEAGLKLTMVNPVYTLDEIKRQLVLSETKAIVTIPLKYSTVMESISDNKSIKLPVIVIQDEAKSTPSGAINFKDLISDRVDEFEKTGQKTERNPKEDTFLLPYSSGTTGLPKCVALTPKNLVMNSLQVKADDYLFPFASETHQEIVPLFLPLFHIYAISSILNTYLSIGAKIICMPQFSSSALFETLEKNKATAIYAVPPVIQLLAYNKRFTPRHMENVKHVLCAAASLSDAVAEKCIQRGGTHFSFTQAPVSVPINIGLIANIIAQFEPRPRHLGCYDLSILRYGLSETSPVISKSEKAPLASSGLILPQTELRIVGCEDENKNKNLGTNEVGEIYVRGPQVMKGYYKNPQATQESMEGEWFKTGDLGLVDDQGFLYIRGRLKELIKVQGYQVAPAELEDIIQGHEKVADVAVIGVPHERYGEIPKAFIVPKPNMRIEDQELKEWVAKRVAKHKQLGHVSIIDKIPKSPTGKILRKELQKIS